MCTPRGAGTRYLGSTHDEAELEALKAAAAVPGGVPDLAPEAVATADPLEIVSSRMGHL